MDVTCEQCKAEYDFDDTLLGDGGTTVKCSKCGHVFRVLPPRREPTRSALKVRFAHDGSVESVASLRELQQRIQAGQVSVDDQLGRDGFTFRRLGDVPELKNFFVRSGSSPGGILPVRAQSETPEARSELPRAAPQPRSDPKRTVMGLGPSGIPSARVRNLAEPPAQALAPTQPGAANPKATVRGRPPISSAPTAPGLPIPPRESPSQRPPTSSAPTAPGTRSTTSGTAPTMQAPLPGGTQTVPAGPNYSPTPSVTRPANTPPGTLDGAAAAGANPPKPAANPVSARAPEGAGAHQPVKLRIPDSVPPGAMKAPAQQNRAFGGDSIGPGALRAAVQPQSDSAPPRSSSGSPVRLQLDEDEALPQRRSSSSKVLISMLALVGLGAAGWFAASKMMGGSPAAVAPSQPEPTLAADASASAEPLAAAPGQPTTGPTEAASDAAAAAAAPQPAKAEVTPTAPAEAPKPTAAAAPKPGGAGKSEPAERTKEPAAESSGREPKDYAGWVARGEQLFSRGDLSGAKAAFETAVGLRASGSEANSGLGSVLLGMGQTREALPYLSRAASNGFAEASVGLGDAYRKLGEKDEAIEAYETYLARLPKGLRANYVQLQLEGLGKDSKPQTEAAPSAGPSEYRPAGEMVEPPSAAPEPSAPAPSESETTP